MVWSYKMTSDVKNWCTLTGTCTCWLNGTKVNLNQYSEWLPRFRKLYPSSLKLTQTTIHETKYVQNKLRQIERSLEGQTSEKKPSHLQ